MATRWRKKINGPPQKRHRWTKPAGNMEKIGEQSSEAVQLESSIYNCRRDCPEVELNPDHFEDAVNQDPMHDNKDSGRRDHLAVELNPDHFEDAVDKDQDHIRDNEDGWPDFPEVESNSDYFEDAVNQDPIHDNKDSGWPDHLAVELNPDHFEDAVDKDQDHIRDNEDGGWPDFPEVESNSDYFEDAVNQDHIHDHEDSGWPDLMEDWTFDDGLQFDEPQTDSREVPMPKDSFDMALYENAPTSVAESLLLIMTYINCHKVTGKALGDLLKLITLLCPKHLNTDCLGSIHKFKDFFSHSVPSPVVMHKYCSNCLSTVHNDDTICKSCEVSLLEEGATSHFIEVSIEAQLQTLFAKKGFQEKLQFRFMRQKKGKDNVEDIYDGQVYKQYASDDGLLCNPHNISFTWNTDGVPIFKSSKFSVWPFYCVINELSFVERTKRENMIFAGLWFGDSKPSMLTFLKPLCEKLHELEEHGLLVKHPETPERFLCKVLTIAGTCDLPAKAMVLNTVQFNGKYGCMKCEQPGTTEKTGERGHMHAFPFQHSDPKGPPRTHEKLVNDAKSAYETKSHVHGVKGPTWLTKVNSFDVILGTGVDYMHSVLLGVMRTLMFLWFSTEFSRQPFSMAKESKEIDKRLSEIHPPSTVTRHPRSVSSHRMYFKASEYRSLLLFFGPVVFYGILGSIYYNHFLLLSEAIFILLMESISNEQIDHAEKLLWNFCSQMGPLYGKRYETANVHLLVHLADSVRALGPLWTHSCFHFEDKNGYLMRLIHGTQNIPMQMIKAVKLVQSLPAVAQTVKPKLAIAEFYARMSNDYSFCSESNKISKETLIGAWTHHKLEGNHLSALQKYAGHPIQNNLVRAFNRAQVGKARLTSRNYKKGLRRNNFTAVFWNGEEKKYGQVEFFFTSEELGHNSKLAIVTEFESAGFHLLRDRVTNGTCFHIAVLLEVPVNVTVVPVEHILGKVVYLDLSSVPGIVFAAHFPNTLEKD